MPPPHQSVEQVSGQEFVPPVHEVPSDSGKHCQTSSEQTGSWHSGQARAVQSWGQVEHVSVPLQVPSPQNSTGTQLLSLVELQPAGQQPSLLIQAVIVVLLQESVASLQAQFTTQASEQGVEQLRALPEQEPLEQISPSVHHCPSLQDSPFLLKSATHCQS